MIARRTSGAARAPRTLIDLGLPATWPVAVRRLADELADVARQCPSSQSGSIANDLAGVSGQFTKTAEARVREALSGHMILAYHATRLLPHEVVGVREAGLLQLSEELRRQKLDQAAAHYPDLLSASEIESIMATGPLAWQGSAVVRLGFTCVVAPIGALTSEAGGLAPLIGQWGGESIYWGAAGVAPAVERLAAVSIPSIIEVAVPASEMVSPGLLLPVVVGVVLGLDRPCHEWHLRRSVRPESVISVIQLGDIRWPTELTTAPSDLPY